MCEKKPGPRCSNHLVTQIETLNQRVVELSAKQQEAEHKSGLAAGRLHNTAVTKRAQEELYDAGNTNPTTSELFEQKAKVVERERAVSSAAAEEEKSLREELKKAKIQQKDLNTRFLGTKTGQKFAQKKAVELRMSGYAKDAVTLEREAKDARALHEANISYAKWAEKVNTGEVPGRMVESKDTAASRFVAHSGDPVYDATREELTKLSSDDLANASSGRYGAFAMTPATKQKISDEKHRRRMVASGEDAKFAAAETQSREKYPDAWKIVKDKTYGDNYLNTDWHTTPYQEESTVLVMSNTIVSEKARVLNDNGDRKEISYPEVLTKAVSKEDVSTATRTGRNATPTLTLDDGRKVAVTREIFSALRFNKSMG